MACSTTEGAIEFTVNGQTTFTGIGSLIPGETRTLGSRVGIGFSKIAGICRVTSAVPGAASGNLYIEQSIDGTEWEQVDTFIMGAATTTSFEIDVVGRYMRARFNVPVGEAYDIRFGAHLNP